MEQGQADLELAILHVKQLETRISQQRAKITRIHAEGLATDLEQEQLAALLRALEIVKAHLAGLTDPGKARRA